MSTGPTNLWDLCVALRNAIEEGYEFYSVALPDRREIVATDVVGECEKLSIEFDRLFVGIAGFAETPVPVNEALTRVTTLNVYLFRCIWMPQGEGLQVAESPSVAELDAESEVILTDAYTLHRVVTRAHFNGDFGGFCSGLSLGPVLPIKAQSGIGGCQMTLTTELS